MSPSLGKATRPAGDTTAAETTGSAAHIQGPAPALGDRGVLGKEVLFALTEPAPPLPLAVVLLPLVAGCVRQRAAPRGAGGAGSGALCGAQPGQGAQAALHQLGITVGGAVGNAGNGIKDGQDRELGLFLRGEGAAVAVHHGLEEIGPAMPGVREPHEVPHGGAVFRPFEVDDVEGVGALVPAQVAELSLGFPELSGNRLMTRPWRSDAGSLECRVLRLFEAAAVLG